MRGACNIEELRRAAKRRLPAMFFDYVDGGAFSEATLRANEADFDDFALTQTVLRDVSRRDLRTEFLGRSHALPLMLGPIGFSGLLAPDGEAAAARAAAAAGIPYCLSTFSIAPLEEVIARGAGQLCFQSYVFRDRALSDALAERAANAGVDVLFLTVDASVASLRERDVRNGFRIAGRLPARAVVDLAFHPRWCLSMMGQRAPKLGNFASWPGAPATLMGQAAAFTSQLDPSLTWDDVVRVRRGWGGRLIVKGIMSVGDARQAVEAGADGIVVSNHGGRQLDGGLSSISALGPNAEAVGDRLEILFDGGVRRGSHVVKALALGASAVLLGRAYAFGLAALGQIGVTAAIELLAREMDVTLALIGVSSIDELRHRGRELTTLRDVPARLLC